MLDKNAKITFLSKIIFFPYSLLFILNVLSIFNIDFTFNKFDPTLIMTIFFITLLPFWLVVILRSNSYLKNYSRGYLWESIKKTLPKKLLGIFYFNIIYSIVSFIVGLAMLKNFNNSNLREFQFFSAHLSIFYCIAFLGNVVFDNLEERKCTNGHLITTSGNFCSECGVKIN